MGVNTTQAEIRARAVVVDIEAKLKTLVAARRTVAAKIRRLAPVAGHSEAAHPQGATVAASGRSLGKGVHTMKPAKEIEAARGTIADLEAKRAALETRRSALAETRSQVAFAAHTGDGEARKRLDGVNLEAATMASKAEALDAAIEEARRRLITAESATARAAEVAIAQAAESAATEIERLAGEIDASARQLRDSVMALLEHAHGLSRTGWPGAPNHRLAQLAAGRALTAALGGIPGLEMPMLAPSQRQTFTQTFAVMVRSARAGAARVLGKKAA
jgi:hypothetical protein